MVWLVAKVDLSIRHSEVYISFRCSILPTGLDKQRGTFINKNIILYFYLSTVTLGWKRRAMEEISRTRRSHREIGLPAETDFSQNSRPCIVLKLPHDPLRILVFHWSRLTPTHCLLFIGPGLHPTHSLFPLILLLILSTARCVYQ